MVFQVHKCVAYLASYLLIQLHLTKQVMQIDQFLWSKLKYHVNDPCFQTSTISYKMGAIVYYDTKKQGVRSNYFQHKPEVLPVINESSKF